MEWMFVEIGEVTRRAVQLGLEEDLRKLQNRLLADPRAGVLDPGTCGLRKLRMTDTPHGRGKRGGVRVHYLLVPKRASIYLVHLYPKGEQTTLTPDQKRILCKLVRMIEAE